MENFQNKINRTFNSISKKSGLVINKLGILYSCKHVLSADPSRTFLGHGKLFLSTSIEDDLCFLCEQCNNKLLNSIKLKEEPIVFIYKKAVEAAYESF